MAIVRIYTLEPEQNPSGETAMCKKYLAEVDSSTEGYDGIVADLVKRFSRIYRTVKYE